MFAANGLAQIDQSILDRCQLATRHISAVKLQVRQHAANCLITGVN